MKQRFSQFLGTPFDAWTIVYRVHATQRMFKREIDENDVAHLIEWGNIIEEYQDDFPFPSVLISGTSANYKPLHAVIGIDFDCLQLYVITVYQPDPDKWSEYYDQRLTP